MADRPRKPVLQPTPTNAPFKKPAGAAVPKGGPLLPQGLPQVPGSPAMAISSGPPSGVRGGIVDANSFHTVTHYAQAQGNTPAEAEQQKYGAGPGLGPTTDLRPPIEDV